MTAVQASAALLSGYYDSVHTATSQFLHTLTEKDYERIVDQSFKPPVSLRVRLMSVLADNLQHVGQAAYVRGLLKTEV